MRSRWSAAIAAVLVLLAGCGGNDGSSSTAAGGASASSSSTLPAPTSTAPPEYVENETCRTQMRPLVDIMLANDVPSLDYGTFDNRVDQLTKKIDAGLAACSKKVTAPARRVMYQFTLARVRWSTCGQHDDECITTVSEAVREGIKLSKRVDYQLDLTV